MASLELTITPKQTNRGRRFLVEIDADKLERLAAAFGFLSDECLKSIEQSEKDYREGRFRKIKSLKELRK